MVLPDRDPKDAAGTSGSVGQVLGGMCGAGGASTMGAEATSRGLGALTAAIATEPSGFGFDVGAVATAFVASSMGFAMTVGPGPHESNPSAKPIHTKRLLMTLPAFQYDYSCQRECDSTRLRIFGRHVV